MVQLSELLVILVASIGDPCSKVSACDCPWPLRAGFIDAEIFAITVFVALRIAFSSVNGALGACPDAALHCTAPKAVLDAVTFGRPIDTSETSLPV